MLSIVIPVYGAPELLNRLFESIENQTKDISTEIILVVDSCPMSSWKEAKSIRVASDNTKLILINLTNNIGQHRAIWEGLRAANGEKIVVMDCDLQDDPKDLSMLLEFSDKHEAVVAIRSVRTDAFFKKASSWIFWKLISFLTGKNIPVNVSNYGVYSKDLVCNLISRNYNSPFLPLNVVTFAKSIRWVSVNQRPRTTSKSSYNFYKLIGLAIRVAISYSRRPFALLISIALLILLATIFATVALMYLVFTTSLTVPGWASLLISISFFGSVSLIFNSVLGMYVVEIFEAQSKHNIPLVAERISVSSD